MRRASLVPVLFLFAASAWAQRVTDPNGNTLHLYPDKSHALEGMVHSQARSGGGSNLVNHGGPVIVSAKVVPIFWGAEWAGPSQLATSIRNFFGQFGSTPEYNTITQYSGIQLTGMGSAYWVDTSAPPTAVSDTAIQNEVIAYLTQPGNSWDSSTIYEVFLPSTSYSTSGGSTSCGGPNLQYCAYHGHFTWNGHDVKYSAMPYPSCGGCQSTGWSVEHNLDHFATHETREAVTDPDLNAWYDRRGYEADDKCAWSPNPFIGTNGYGYQYEWSNADSACVKTK